LNRKIRNTNKIELSLFFFNLNNYYFPHFKEK
jgi:hypothetical protein